MKKNILPFVLLTLFTACSKLNTDITQFKWLEGRWEGTEGKMKIFEEWQPLKDNKMLGVGGAFSDKDTLFAEKITIEKINSELYYIATVPGNKKPVAFKLIRSENTSATFENLEHDFPQRVIYTQNADGSLYACIEGKRSGKDSKEEFIFKKAD